MARTKVKVVDGENILYHIIQKHIIDADDADNPSDEIKFLIEQLLLLGGVWFKPKTYAKLPVLLPYVVRHNKCRKKKTLTSKDTRGMANPKGYLTDDNSSIKDIPDSLKIESRIKKMNGAKLGNGFRASHIWLQLRSMPDLHAANYERTNSFIPVLVWLPTQISKLTDREGSYAQRFMQYISGLIYKDVALSNETLNNIWDELTIPEITPVSRIDLAQLNYFEDNIAWLTRRKNKLNDELQSILNILVGDEPIIKKINVGNYIPSLKQMVPAMNIKDKANLKNWIEANL